MLALPSHGLLRRAPAGRDEVHRVLYRRLPGPRCSVSDRLLTRAQVANELACSVSTVKRRIRGGELPAVVDGRLVRVREADLRRYVLERLTRANGGRPVELLGRPLPAGARLWE